MAGRTERVNANEVVDRMWQVFFEGREVSAWLTQLRTRAERALAAAEKNPYFQDGAWRTEMEDLGSALDALSTAQAELKRVAEAASRRERMN